jgi:hypothetical protein
VAIGLVLRLRTVKSAQEPVQRVVAVRDADDAHLLNIYFPENTPQLHYKGESRYYARFEVVTVVLLRIQVFEITESAGTVTVSCEFQIDSYLRVKCRVGEC